MSNNATKRTTPFVRVSDRDLRAARQMGSTVHANISSGAARARRANRLQGNRDGLDK